MNKWERLRRKNEFDGNLSIGVKTFNESTRRDKYFRQSVIKRERLIDPGTGLLREGLGSYRSCPACGADNASAIFVKRGFHHVKCNVCSMVYVNPTLNEKKLVHDNTNETLWAKVLTSGLQQELDRKKYVYGLEIIEEHMPRKGRILDIGCGTGFFLQVARERSWEVYGVEYNKWCVRLLKKNRINVSANPIEHSSLPANFFQSITMWDVFEHIIDPAPVLSEIRRIIAPDGILAILVPNINGLVSRLLHEKAGTFSGDSHVNFFSEKTLSTLLARWNFEVIERETLFTELGTISNYLNYEDPYFGSGKQAVKFLTPKYIHDNMLGSRLFFIARLARR